MTALTGVDRINAAVAVVAECLLFLEGSSEVCAYECDSSTSAADRELVQSCGYAAQRAVNDQEEQI